MLELSLDIAIILVVVGKANLLLCMNGVLISGGGHENFGAEQNANNTAD